MEGDFGYPMKFLFQYEKGKLVKMIIEGISTTYYEYDRTGNLIKEIQKDVKNEVVKETELVVEQTSSAEQMMSSCEILTKSSQDALDQVKEFSKGIVITELKKKEINRFDGLF